MQYHLKSLNLHTNTDPNLNAVRKAIESGDCCTDRVKPFLNIKEEIAVDHANGILLRGTRVVIPSTLQANIISLAHKGHQVLAKTKASLREYAWFPSIDKPVKDELANMPTLSNHIYDQLSHLNPCRRRRWLTDLGKQFPLISMVLFPRDSVLSS